MDMADPSRVAREPDQTAELGCVRCSVRGVGVRGLQLRLYREGAHPSLGDKVLITAVLVSDRGTAECVYDEGYLGHDPLGRAVRFLSAAGAAPAVERLAVSMADALDI